MTIDHHVIVVLGLDVKVCQLSNMEDCYRA